MYKKMIIEFTGCAESDANQVQEYMRIQYHTLDHLSRATFRREAKAAYDALLWSRTPEGIAYQEQLEKEFYSVPSL